MNSPRLTFTVAPIVQTHGRTKPFLTTTLPQFWRLAPWELVSCKKLPVLNHWPPSMFFCCSVLRRYQNRCCQRNLILPKSRHAILWRLAGIGPRVCIYSDWVRIPSKRQVRRESTQTCLFCQSQTSLSQFRRDGQWRKHCMSSSSTGNGSRIKGRAQLLMSGQNSEHYPVTQWNAAVLNHFESQQMCQVGYCDKLVSTQGRVRNVCTRTLVSRQFCTRHITGGVDGYEPTKTPCNFASFSGCARSRG